MGITYKSDPPAHYPDWESWVEDHDKRDVKFQENVLRVIGQHVSTEIKAATEPLKRRLADLEFGMKEFRYVGVWATGKYHRGNFVTHGGSLWHCNLDTDRMPGRDAQAWTLCVKHGKDGRDRDAAA